MRYRPLFDRPGLTEVLSGRVMELFDGSTAAYAGAGVYRYVYEAGEVCVTFDNGKSLGDINVQYAGRLC